MTTISKLYHRRGGIIADHASNCVLVERVPTDAHDHGKHALFCGPASASEVSFDGVLDMLADGLDCAGY